MSPLTRTPLVVALAATFSVFPQTVRGQCVEFRDYLHWIGGLETPGPAQDLALAHDIVNGFQDGDPPSA